MQDKIKCGVIGAGWWATFAHIPALLNHPNAELVAIQKRNLQEAQKVADDFGIPIACTTPNELLSHRRSSGGCRQQQPSPSLRARIGSSRIG